ncbi:MAG: CapA family protein [Treponema sp.]|nr:CapA family protein [Treponema sp.]
MKSKKIIVKNVQKFLFLNNSIFLFFILIFISCATSSVASDINYLSEINESGEISQTFYAGIESNEEKIPKEYSIAFIAAGDNLFHESIINSSYQNGVYDFTPVYSEIKDIIGNADLAFINQETVMAGESYGYSGYPRFNTPQSLSRTLADTGFDIVNLANNHAMDMGKDGLYSTLDFLDTIQELTVIGARKEGESARIITVNNITLGFLSYTYGLNGFQLPADNPNLVSLINREKMASEIYELRPLCDFLIVSIHWGEEYRLEPDSNQVNLAFFFAQHNVDLVIGHHPHVLQRAQTIVRDDGRETLVIYSLGNFVSNQVQRERIIGGVACITFTKIDSAPPELSISDFGIIPVITHYSRNFSNTKIYPLYSYTEDLLSVHGLKNQDSTLDMDFFNAVTERLDTKIITQNPF